MISGVSGEISGGASIQIAGRSFGTKSPAHPLIWDNFESGTVGARVENQNAVVGQWQTSAYSSRVFYTDRQSLSGQKSALHPFYRVDGSDMTNTWSSQLALNANSFPLVYAEFFTYYPASNGTASNYKPYRFFGNSDAMQVVMGANCGNMVVDLLDPPSRFVAYDGTLWQTNRWQQYQILYRQSSQPGQRDAIYRNYVDGQTRFTGFYIPGANPQVYYEPDNLATNHTINQLRLGGEYFDVGQRGECDPDDHAELFTDNVYVDTTFARVTIGNANTYDGSTIRDIQIPTAWSSGSVTVNVNLPRFSSGQTAYLYVHDQDDRVNASGYPITIGSSNGGIDTTAPAAPGSFRRE